MPVREGRASPSVFFCQDGSKVLIVFDSLRSRLEQFLADQTVAPDSRLRAAGLKAALLDAKVALSAMRDALVRTEHELSAERQQLENAERRGRLAEAVPDPQTVEVAIRFAARHRERVTVLERKHSVQHDELVLAEREYEEMVVQFRAARSGVDPMASRRGGPDPENASGLTMDDDQKDDLLKSRLDRAKLEAAAEEQLAHLKKKFGKDKS